MRMIGIFSGPRETGTARSQSMVVRVTEANGVHRDVTAEAKFTVADAAKAKIEKGVVVPPADGETKLKIEWNGHAVEVPVKVAGNSPNH